MNKLATVPSSKKKKKCRDKKNEAEKKNCMIYRIAKNEEAQQRQPMLRRAAHGCPSGHDAPGCREVCHRTDSIWTESPGVKRNLPREDGTKV